MSLTPEEAALFGSFETIAPSLSVPAPVDDDWGLDDSKPLHSLPPLSDAAGEAMARVLDVPAIIPPDAPANSKTPDAEPVPEKKTRKPRAVKAEPAERIPPGWKDAFCSVCGHNFGPRAPDHIVDPICCPNQSGHAAAGVPRLAGSAQNATIVEIGPNTIQVLRDLISAITNLPSPSQD